AGRPAAGDDSPNPAPAAAAAACTRLPAAAPVEEPERDLFRIEKISDAMKKITMGRICKAIESGRLDDVQAAFAPQASVQRLLPRREAVIKEFAGTRAGILSYPEPCAAGAAE